LSGVDCDEEVRKEWAEKTDDYWVKDGEAVVTYDPRFYREFTEAEVEKHGPLSMMGCGCGGGHSWDSRDWDDGKGYRPKIKMTDEEIEAMGYVNEDRPISDGITYDSIEEFAEDWYGYKVRNGKFGRFTNPNAQWDWWQIGGRRSGKLTTKDGKKVDHGHMGEIAWRDMREFGEKSERKDWDDKNKVIAGRKLIPFDTFREATPDDIQAARDAYWAQPVLEDLNATYPKDFFTEWPPYFKPKDEYVKAGGESAITTFAFLGTDGKWQQRGDMGWWGCVSDEDDNWGNGFSELLDTVKPGQYVWVVDCHI
jgi:hypothetical protein